MAIIPKMKERTVQSSQKNTQLTVLAKVFDVPIEMISTNPDQPRKNFDIAELTKLAKSISQDGIVQPLTVKRYQKGFRLISGERRLRAAKMAGFRTVPCVMAEISEKRSAVISLIENIQRADLHFFEEAEAIACLIEKYSMTQEDTAIRLGLAQSTIANKLRLLRLSGEERNIILTKGLTERHARALLKIVDPVRRREILDKIVSENMTVAEAERYIQNEDKRRDMKKSYEKRSPVLKDIKLFNNTISKAVEVIRLAGVDAQMDKTEQGGFIEYRIRIKEKSDEQ